MRLDDVTKKRLDGLFLARRGALCGEVALAQSSLRQHLLRGRAGLIRRDGSVAAQNRALDREGAPAPWRGTRQSRKPTCSRS
jgi:hypothetical protein